MTLLRQGGFRLFILKILFECSKSYRHILSLFLDTLKSKGYCSSGNLMHKAKYIYISLK